jgi:hypothetical protein
VNAVRLPPSGITVQTYSNAIKAGNRTHVRLTFPLKQIAVEDEDIDATIGVTINDIFNAEEDLRFGRVLCKKLTAGIIMSDKTRDISWGSRFRVEFGVEINGTTRYVTFGWFRGDQVKRNYDDDTVTVVAYDDAVRFDAEITSDFIKTLTFPIKFPALYSAVCQYTGVKMKLGWMPDDIPFGCKNEEYTKADLKKFHTFREILEDMSGAFGYYIRVNSEGECEWVWFNDATEAVSLAAADLFGVNIDAVEEHYPGTTWNEASAHTWDWYKNRGITWDDFKAYRIDNKFTGVDVVFENDITYTANSPVYKTSKLYFISDDLFTRDTFSDYTDMVDTIRDKLDSFGAWPQMSVESAGNWLVESGDVISVYTKIGTLKMPIFFRTFTWNGVPSDAYESTGITIKKINH